jgi:hypothetical protein
MKYEDCAGKEVANKSTIFSGSSRKFASSAVIVPLNAETKNA